MGLPEQVQELWRSGQLTEAYAACVEAKITPPAELTAEVAEAQAPPLRRLAGADLELACRRDDRGLVLLEDAMTENHQRGGGPGQGEAPVTLEGTAYDSKAGAILDSDHNGVVYIQGLECWPAHLNGQRMTVTGLLRDEKFIPDPEVGADGGISQGAFGGQTSLVNATWKLSR